MRLANHSALVSAVVLLLSGLPAALGFERSFRRGDADGSGTHDISDAIVLLNFLFGGKDRIDCEDAADANDDSSINIADPLYVLNFLFAGGPRPPAPYAKPGLDPTPDAYFCSGCGDGVRLANVALCATQTCSVVEDVFLQPARQFRNGSPSIVLDAAGEPHILFATAESMFVGHYARRNAAGDWSVELMTAGNTEEPVEFAIGEVVLDLESRPQAIVYDGAFGSFLWRLGGAGWQLVGQLEGVYTAGTASAVTSSAGCVYVPVDPLSEAGDDGIAVGIHTDEWEFIPIPGAPHATRPVIALSPAGEPHVAFWDSIPEEGGWHLRLSTGFRAPATLAALNGSALERSFIGLAVSPAARRSELPRLHVFFHRRLGDGDAAHALDYATRDAGGEWRFLRVAADEGELDTSVECGEPVEQGQECENSYTLYTGIGAVVNSAGDPLLVYSKVRVTESLVAECQAECYWQSQVKLAGELRLAWLESGEIRTAPLLLATVPVTGAVALGPGGDLHCVYYDGPDGFGSSAVRYVRVGTR